MKNAAVIIAALGVLAGCMSIPDAPPREYFVLVDLGQPAALTSGAAGGPVLLVSPASASPFYDTQNLVFSRAPGQRAYYQFAGWTERPGHRLSELLTRRLEAGGNFQSVAATTAGVRGDFVLNTRLEEFYHDAAANPGSVRIEVTAELVDFGKLAVIARRRFAQSAPTSGGNAQAAVSAFNQATTALLDEMSAWVGGAATPARAR